MPGGWCLSFPTGRTSGTTKSAAAAVAAVAAATALLLEVRRRSEKRRRSAARKGGWEKVKLLPSESSFVVRTSPPMSTITFFEAASIEDVNTARSFFESRAIAIVNANPWLSGFLDADDDDDESKGGNLALFVPPKDGGDNNNNNSGSSSPHFSVLDDSLGSLPEDDYHSMVEALGPVLIGTTDEHVASLDNDDDDDSSSWEPLWKVAFVPLTTNTNTTDGGGGTPHRFALVVSGNHTLLDGHGYYRLFNMLSSKEPVVGLSPVRNHDLGPAIDTATGLEPSLLAEPPLGFVLGFLAATVRNAVFPRTTSVGVVISRDWIRRRKEAYRESVASSATASSSGGPPPPPPFVSTNDLVVSEFCRRTGCDVALMAINLRGKVAGCTDDLVGNYEHLIGYTGRDCGSPADIRKSVTGPVYERSGAAIAGDEMPTGTDHALRCTYAVTTSWATFARDLTVGGDSNSNSNHKTGAATTKQSLHVPLFDFPKSTPAASYSSMVVFRPREGEIAILCGGTAELMEELAASDMVGSVLYHPNRR